MLYWKGRVRGLSSNWAEWKLKTIDLFLDEIVQFFFNLHENLISFRVVRLWRQVFF